MQDSLINIYTKFNGRMEILKPTMEQRDFEKPFGVITPKNLTTDPLKQFFRKIISFGKTSQDAIIAQPTSKPLPSKPSARETPLTPAESSTLAESGIVKREWLKGDY